MRSTCLTTHLPSTPVRWPSRPGPKTVRPFNQLASQELCDQTEAAGFSRKNASFYYEVCFKDVAPSWHWVTLRWLMGHMETGGLTTRPTRNREMTGITSWCVHKGQQITIQPSNLTPKRRCKKGKKKNQTSNFQGLPLGGVNSPSLYFQYVQHSVGEKLRNAAFLVSCGGYPLM